MPLPALIVAAQEIEIKGVFLDATRARETTKNPVWTVRRASELGEAGTGDSVQDLGRARSQAAQEPALAKAGVRYYLEQRDPEFEPKMAEILCVYRQVAMLRNEAAKGQDSGGGLVIVSYDEKPVIQAIGTTAPDRDA
jgi:hypothetical protein